MINYQSLKLKINQSWPFKYENNTYTLPEQLLDNAGKVQITTFFIPKTFQNDYGIKSGFKFD